MYLERGGHTGGGKRPGRRPGWGEGRGPPRPPPGGGGGGAPEEAGVAAVVHVQHGEAAAGPVLDLEAEDAGGSRGRSAVALDNQRRSLARWSYEVAVLRPVVEAVGG